MYNCMCGSTFPHLTHGTGTSMYEAGVFYSLYSKSVWTVKLWTVELWTVQYEALLASLRPKTSMKHG